VTPRRRLVFVIVVAAQLILPLAMIGANELALATGTKVTLLTAPVDPLDPFRGRYVELSYEISRLPAWAATKGTAYVELERRGDRWVVYDVHPIHPHGDRPVIRGQATGRSVVYGIETYFVDEDEAPRLERVQGRLLVDVVVDADGKARIDGVRVR
jgi:uncharacterized membrane-anchored protein